MTIINGKIQQEVDELKEKYHDMRFCLLPTLYIFQREYGWLRPDVMEAVGEVLNLPRATVRSVATFYTMFRQRPMGRHLIQLCTNVSCMVMGGERLLDILKDRYNLEPNATSPDSRFSLVIMECIGACDTAPAMLVDTDLHGGLNESSLLEVLERYP